MSSSAPRRTAAAAAAAGLGAGEVRVAGSRHAQCSRAIRGPSIAKVGTKANPVWQKTWDEKREYVLDLYDAGDRRHRARSRPVLCVSLAAVRTAIVARLNTVTDIGMVHAYERYASD
jgi:hypothetical protein